MNPRKMSAPKSERIRIFPINKRLAHFMKNNIQIQKNKSHKAYILKLLTSISMSSFLGRRR